MDKFEILNRQTRDYKNNHCDPHPQPENYR